MMYLAIAVAKHIVTYCTNKNKPVSNLKLQKILYYVWIDYYKKTGDMLFLDEMQAWQFGPVVPNVYYEFCQYAGLEICREYQEECDIADISLIDSVIDKYIDVPTSTLIDWSHRPNKPWDKVYKSGRGFRQKIPYDMIIDLECSC